MTMPFSTLASTLEALEPVTSRIQMVSILAELLSKAEPDEVCELVYLTQGRLLPDFIQEEFGMNERLIVRSISQAYGMPADEVLARHKELGDIGLTAQEFAGRGPAAAEGDGVPLKQVYSRLMDVTKTI